MTGNDYVKIRYRYVYEDVDRHGNVRVYFWSRPARKVRIKEVPGVRRSLDDIEICWREGHARTPRDRLL